MERISLALIRNQLQIAQALAKSHVGFVVIPVATAKEFECLRLHQVGVLEALDEDENNQRDTKNDTP